MPEDRLSHSHGKEEHWSVDFFVADDIKNGILNMQREMFSAMRGTHVRAQQEWTNVFYLSKCDNISVAQTWVIQPFEERFITGEVG